MKTIPIVALNHKAEIIGSFDSLDDAALYMGTSRANIGGKMYHGKTYKQILFIKEQDYRKLYYEGRTDELRFPTRKEKMNRKLKEMYSKLTKEEREERMKVCREGHRRWRSDPENRRKMQMKKTCIPVMCVQTGERWASINALGRHLGCPPGTIHRCIIEGRDYEGKTYIKVKKDEKGTDQG